LTFQNDQQLTQRLKPNLIIGLSDVETSDHSKKRGISLKPYEREINMQVNE